MARDECLGVNTEWLVIQGTVGLNRRNKAIFFFQFPIPTPSVTNGKILVVPAKGVRKWSRAKAKEGGPSGG